MNGEDESVLKALSRDRRKISTSCLVQFPEGKLYVFCSFHEIVEEQLNNLNYVASLLMWA